ncbi:MAG: hypothetical protein Q9227_007257 [Pyrenula ochraceoflavens]
MSKPTILLIGTLDTKLEEITFLRNEILRLNSCHVKILDVGINPNTLSASPSAPLSQDDLLSFPRPDTSTLDRSSYISRLLPPATSTVHSLITSHQIHALISAGGSSGTSLATSIMRNAAPIGFPKLMLSTIASGDVKPLVEETDITLMYSVLDIAGLNSILRGILANAAAAIVGMALAYHHRSSSAIPTSSSSHEHENEEAKRKKRIGITMFGVTTPCVDQIRRLLPPSTYETFIFHATGSGGRAMERLITESSLDAIIDLTTSEIPDHLFGGNMSAGPERLSAAAKFGVPQVISVGACDMVNFGTRESVPERYRERNLYVHNPAVTLMRTTREENGEIGRFIAGQVRRYAVDEEKAVVLLPSGGVSMLDSPGQAYWDPEADGELFRAIEGGFEGSKVRVERVEENVNDESFARRCASTIEALLSK